MFKGAIIVMGATSCGKTSVGEKLAATLVVPFIEGDTLHPAANIEKMSRGTALNDEDRWPWLERIGTALQGDTAKVASCSALKRVYRQRLATAAGRPIAYVFLHGTRDLLASRIAARRNHFMPSSLLDSQLAVLEPPTPEEGAMTFDIRLTVDEIVKRALALLTK